MKKKIDKLAFRTWATVLVPTISFIHSAKEQVYAPNTDYPIQQSAKQAKSPCLREAVTLHGMRFTFVLPAEI